MILCENCSPRKQCMEDKNRTECKYYQPITEQEYIQTCNTEQLAEFIAQYLYGWTTNSTPYDIVLHSVREWLKQPHTEKE